VPRVFNDFLELPVDQPINLGNTPLPGIVSEIAPSAGFQPGDVLLTAKLAEAFRGHGAPVVYVRVDCLDVQLQGTSDEIHLTVSDYGVGFNLEAARKGQGLGLNRMEERLKLVKGGLSIDSQHNRGTTIDARVPLSLGSDSTRVTANLCAWVRTESKAELPPQVPPRRMSDVARAASAVLSP
jgi:hypothetical protein